jgi:hypothetical protein
VGAAIYDAHGNAFASYRREGAAGVFKVPTVEGETQHFDDAARARLKTSGEHS